MLMMPDVKINQIPYASSIPGTVIKVHVTHSVWSVDAMDIWNTFYNI